MLSFMQLCRSYKRFRLLSKRKIIIMNHLKAVNIDKIQDNFKMTYRSRYETIHIGPGESWTHWQLISLVSF